MWADWLEPASLRQFLYSSSCLATLAHIIISFLIFRDALFLFKDASIFEIQDKILKFQVPSKYTIYSKYTFPIWLFLFALVILFSIIKVGD